MMSTNGFDKMLTSLQSAMPGWSSFDDQRLQERETAYKREASVKAKALLGKDTMQELLSQEQWDEILKRLETIGKLTNLLWNRAPRQGDMAVLFADTLDKEGYTRQVFDLLHGDGDPDTRFGGYLSYVEEHGLPNSWTFPTYLLFLFHPETEFFVKPSVTQWFLRQAGDNSAWQSTPSVNDYRRIKDHIRRFGQLLAAFKPTDMIDLQSAVYMARNEIKHSQKIWWVNQGRTYREACEGGFLWAPLRNKAGRTERHWESMADVRQGDIILHYSNGALRAVSRVSEEAILHSCPPEIESDNWRPEGRYVKSDYTPFDQPIPIEAFIDQREVRTITSGPINERGIVKQGYLFPFSVKALSKVVLSSTVDWPDYVRSIVNVSPPDGSQVAWIFQGNPDRYDVMDAVTNLEECTWTVHQYANKVRPGDMAYIWESGRNAGVIAIGQVLTKPEPMTRLDEEEPYFRDASLVGSEPAPRVRIGIQRVLSAKITRDQFKDHPILSQATILKQPQGTVFPLSPEQAAALEDLISGSQRTGRTVRISLNLSLWDDCLGQGYISVGWREVGDLRQYASLDEVIAAVNQHMAQQYPTARQRELVAHQLWLFRSVIPGDEVVATHGTSTILGIGRVREPGYAWNQERGHNILIDWDESVAKRIAKQPHWRMAQVDMADLELTELARQLGSGLPKPNTDLSVICDQFTSALLGSNVRFGARHDEIARSFVVSLATKRLVILTGLSGSGKTQLAVRFGEWLGEGHSCVVAARPDWTGSEALFGYEDALQEPDENGRRPWHVPEALAFMLQAAHDPEHPYLLVLDEMNLAHVERYFADVLSGMESEQPVLPNLRAEDDGRWRVAPDAPERIAIPENLFVVGTVNVDETTYMFSPKVLDRANTIEFRVNSDDLTEVARRPVPIEPGEPELVRGFLVIATDDDWHLTQTAVDLAQFTGYLRKLHRVLADSHVQFGHRVVYEANRFAALLAAAGVSDIAAALDLQVLQKVLPRVHGSKRRLGPVLSALGRFCFNPDTLGEGGEEDTSSFDPLNPPDGEPKLPYSFHKLGRMVRNLNADQFTSFAE